MAAYINDTEHPESPEWWRSARAVAAEMVRDIPSTDIVTASVYSTGGGFSATRWSAGPRSVEVVTADGRAVTAPHDPRGFSVWFYRSDDDDPTAGYCESWQQVALAVGEWLGMLDDDAERCVSCFDDMTDRTRWHLDGTGPRCFHCHDTERAERAERERRAELSAW